MTSIFLHQIDEIVETEAKDACMVELQASGTSLYLGASVAGLASMIFLLVMLVDR